MYDTKQASGKMADDNIDYGEMIGLPDELATEKRMAAAVKALGVDYVFDTNYTADLTIMEEGSEFLGFLSGRNDLAGIFDYEFFYAAGT